MLYLVTVICSISLLKQRARVYAQERKTPMPKQSGMPPAHDDDADQLGDADEHDMSMRQLFVRMPHDIRTSIVALARELGIPAGSLITYVFLYFSDHEDENGQLSQKAKQTIMDWYKAWKAQQR